MYDKQFFLRINEEEKPQAEALAQAITEILAPESVVDVGCATGLYLKPFLDQGIRVRGIDKALAAWSLAVIPQDLIWVMDITEEFPDVGKWDVALCLELLEHVEEADAALDNLTSFADTIVFSAASPGQGGEGHINCQPKDYWLDKFALRGYRPNQEIVERILQRVAELYPQRMGWLDANLIVLEKKRMELHFISTAEDFPYPYYLAVVSALKTHNVGEANLWCTVLPVGKYFQALRDKVNVVMVDVPDFPALQGKDAKFIAAHTKDYLQWKILSERGGLYMDLDTFSVQDLTCLLGDKELLAPLQVPDMEACAFSFESAITAVRQSSPIIKSIFRYVEGKLLQSDVCWGDTTPIIFSTIVREHLDDVVVLKQEVCSPFRGGELLYDDIELPAETRAIHLYASHKPYFAEIDRDFVEHGNTLYARTVRATLSEEERYPWEENAVDIDRWVSLWGSRYRGLFETLTSGTYRNILEIGTHSGENALHLIASAAQNVPEADIRYFGFDLFEEAPAGELSLGDYYSRAEAYTKLTSHTKTAVQLFEGDTKETLRAADLPQMDFIFVDGGHSIDTIRNDWGCIQHLMGPDTVVFFDDYYEEMGFVGCKFLEGEIDPVVYNVDILPEKDVYNQPWGRLQIQLLKVSRHPEVSRTIPKYPKVSQVISQHNPTFRFHLLGLAHVPTSREFMPCAYSQKIVKMGTMLKDLGHTVYFYGGEGSDLDCDEMVQVVSNQDRIDCYGDYDWKTEFFKLSGTDSCHSTFNENAIEEINARKQDDDLVLCPMGWWHKPITDAVGLEAIEAGIGYSGVFAKYKVFESYAWMHHVYGLSQQHDGSWYDCVIPNYFDPTDFPYQEQKDDYFLYIGRLVRRKGIQIAVEVTKKIGAKLIIAGQGSLINPDEGLSIADDHVEHVGTVGPEQRAELMGHARAVFVPTQYIEPFGGVAVEAMMCGAPVITSDWGAMSETVLPQITGFRCRTFGEFVWAAENIDRIKPTDCREWAINNYSMDRVKWQYQAFFEQVKDLRGDGWYDSRHRGVSEYQRFRKMGVML